MSRSAPFTGISPKPSKRGCWKRKAVLALDDAEVDEILAAFERCGTVDSLKLGPAHAALDGRYDYGILKCLLAELG